MHAELQFLFEGRQGSTAFRTLRQDPPWKVVRGFQLPTGECLAHLNNVSGGIFGGDVLRMDCRVEPGAQAQLTTTGATRLYFPRAEAREAVLSSQFHLGEGALLEYVPDALIPFEDARAVQHTSFSLEQGATLFAWDTIAPGRAASGERFRYERLRLINEVHVGGMPVLNDRLLLEPRRWAMNSPGRYGFASSYLVTFLAVQAGASKIRLRALEAQLNELLAEHSDPQAGEMWGATALPAHGVMVRGAACSSLHLPALLQKLWTICKQDLMGRAVTPPRKTY
ncbi:MAG: urease accessory protein UreD [Acidobacteriaceae bacterium]|nr:urease accessory protein UreD [Acidobacteriaceae bacterium]